MHEPGFDDDLPDMVDEHEEFCPCDECCYTQEELDQAEVELLQSNRDFWLECMQDPDLPY